MLLWQVVLFITVLTVVFAVLIWYGFGDNPIDPEEMAQVSGPLRRKYCALFTVLLKEGRAVTPSSSVR